MPADLFTSARPVSRAATKLHGNLRAPAGRPGALTERPSRVIKWRIGMLLAWALGLTALSQSVGGAAPPAPAASASKAATGAMTRPDPGPARGGGQQADFDSLIELIQSTVAPDTWEEVGGEGAISGFPGGVYVDTSGVLRRLDSQLEGRLSTVWRAAQLSASRDAGDHAVSRPSSLRKVSLRRLLEHLERLERVGERPSLDVRFLAGLQRVDAILLEGETGDCILAGPAGPWILDEQGRYVGLDTGRPVLRLDDLVVLLRNAFRGGGHFVCSITPTQANLRRTQEFLEASSQQPVPPGQRDVWLQQLRQALGRQRIEISGIDPETRAARVIVEADFHMKLVGLGLAPAVGDLVSYLDAVEASAGGEADDVGLLRWWFTLPDRCVGRADGGSLFLLADQMVQVLSENELLTERGERVHTGRSEPLNQRFAREFTQNFTQLAEQYPIYAELDNVFRLAVVAAVLQQEDVPGRTDWSIDHFLNDHSYVVPRTRAPREVLSVVSFRELDRRRFLAAVSGGVSFSGAQLYRSGFAPARAEAAVARPSLDPPRGSSDEAWWWD